MSRPDLEMSIFATDYGAILLNVYLGTKTSANLTLLLTPDLAEQLADELGLAVEKARKILIERAS